MVAVKRAAPHGYLYVDCGGCRVAFDGTTVAKAVGRAAL